jgi:hypothetical protein
MNVPSSHPAPSPFARPSVSPAVTVVLLGAGLLTLVAGLWAFFAPESFAVFVAFPFNLHLLHDAGAFQLGISAALLLALLWADGVMVALGAFVVGSAFHFVAHVIDGHLGGHSYDVPLLALLLIIGLGAMYARAKGNP